VELFPLFSFRLGALDAQGDTGGRPEEGVKLMKLAAAKPVVPIVSLHKIG
jgi:hypothetical protein